LRRFDPRARRERKRGYSVSVDLAADNRRLLEVLDAIQQHVHQLNDVAREELDGWKDTVFPAVVLVRQLNLRQGSQIQRRTLAMPRVSGATATISPTTIQNSDAFWKRPTLKFDSITPPRSGRSALPAMHSLR
jgi:hypothetical protein